MESCCEKKEKKKFDYILWFCGITAISMYILHWQFPQIAESYYWLNTMSDGIFELLNTVWWGVIVGIVMLSILSTIPKEFIISILGDAKGTAGILKATLAGVLLDLCSHGILMVGAKLYDKGVSIGQVMAFLIASPWNSLSLTLILIALIGLKLTIIFIILSAMIAIITGIIFNILVKRKILPDNPNKIDMPDDFKFMKEAKKSLKRTEFSPSFFIKALITGIKESKMVVKWLLFGIILASIIRAFVDADDFSSWFGPDLMGLTLTIIAATIIEACSEGSTPIAADIINRANAPGNGFAFLMTGVSTDYTEIMVLKETTKSWKISLFLPLITLPQVILISYIVNIM